jgi:hypothetical protein
VNRAEERAGGTAGTLHDAGHVVRAQSTVGEANGVARARAHAPARVRAHAVDRFLDTRGPEETEGPGKVQRERPVYGREVEGEQARCRDGLEEEHHIEQAGGGEGEGVAGVDEGSEEGKEGHAGGCPLGSGLTSRPAVGQCSLNAGNDLVGLGVGDRELGERLEIRDLVGDARQTRGDIDGGGEGDRVRAREVIRGQRTKGMAQDGAHIY